MGKWYTKEEKIKIIKYYHKNGHMNTIKNLLLQRKLYADELKSQMKII
ncbi:hypothetical protein M1771_07745 [Spiroplasma citri]|nr:hypothetical protein [Spiroplasma citri]WFG99883.1 hypothetical protein M1771_07745 [Spiroplasma citri]